MEKRAASELLYKSNRLHVSMVYRLINHSWDVGRSLSRRKHELQASVFYISRVFSNVRGVLSQCNTRLRLLHLLHDLDLTRAKQ